MNGQRTATRARPAAPVADPFASDFSQARTSSAAISWPVLQWHGGLAHLVGDGDTVKINGGFFIEDDRVADMGLDPNSPPPAFERIALRLGGKQITGWGASELHLAVLFSDFNWEDRETGRQRFAATEYERRRQQAPGTERELRGRTRALVAVRELLDEGVTEPMVFSVRGSYSAAFNAILRDLTRMAAEATKLRRRAGHDGAIPREAFWSPIHAGAMEIVGEGSNSSRVALPKSDIPRDLSREVLVSYLVEEMHRRPGGTFDEWAERYQEAWAEKSSPTEAVDVVSAPIDDGYAEEVAW